MKPGDRVKYHNADDPKNIPAYRDMRGTLLRISANQRHAEVKWDCDEGAVTFLPAHHIVKAE